MSYKDKCTCPEVAVAGPEEKHVTFDDTTVTKTPAAPVRIKLTCVVT